MQFTFAHNNINVLNLEKSFAFYREALQLTEARRYKAPDGSFIIVFLGDGQTPHQLELTWLKGRQEPYNLGDNEFHLALKVDDFAGAHALHEKMGCICYENKAMGIYFINDPDDYWIEIIPQRDDLKIKKPPAFAVRGLLTLVNFLFIAFSHADFIRIPRRQGGGSPARVTFRLFAG